MATLENKSPSEFYKDLVHTSNSNAGAHTNSTTLQTGNGNSTALSLGKKQCIVQPESNGVNSFDVKDASGTSLFRVDTTNSRVMTGSTPINLQVKEFNLSYVSAFPSSADTWTALPACAGVQDTLSVLEMGASSGVPTATKTITGNAQRIMPYFWYVPLNIELYAVKAQTTCDTTTGDNFLYAVSKYTLNSGNTASSGDLSSGAQIAISSVQSSAGNEQIYYNDLVLSSATVSAGQVVIAYVAQNGVNSDLSCNLQIFYRFV
jgi:hypothetical protein